MTIILVRHGAYNNYSIDREEGLSEEGKVEVKELLKLLKTKEIFFSKIYVSPKKRAKETAHILSEGNDIEETELLKGGHSPEDILPLLVSEQTEVILLVGHNPYMEDLSTLLGHTTSFNTAGCAIFKDNKLMFRK
jgi:phosphohistidine phosphatase